MLRWAAIQDWMCEPWILKKTGGTVAQHQTATVRSYLDLREIAPDLPWTPVVQGYTLDDYLRCIEMYDRAGVDLCIEPVVGLGSICRRQGTQEIVEIARVLAGMGIRLHGFGVKTLGLPALQQYMVSTDSMAWSFAARRLQRPFFSACRSHKNCANCLSFALHWRRELLAITRDTMAQGLTQGALL